MPHIRFVENSDKENDRATLEKIYDWGAKNAEFHVDCSDTITSQANASLAIVLTGVAGALALGVHLLDEHKPWPHIIASFGTGLYLYALVIGIFKSCLSPRSVVPPYNEPDSYFQAALTWEEIVNGDIQNLTNRINSIKFCNGVRGDSLKKYQFAALASPLVYFITLGAAALLVSALAP